MKKVLFVCLGNICRSPLAEGILLHLKQQHGLQLHVDSAGTSGHHVGEAPDPRTIANAARNGIDLRQLRARQFCTHDFSYFDHIYVMDKSNLRHVLNMATSNAERAKVKLLLHEAHGDPHREVPDPWYGGEEGFEEVFQLLWEACEYLRREFSKPPAK